MSKTNPKTTVALGRRDLLKLPAMAAVCGVFPYSAASQKTPLNDVDLEGTKIAIKLTVQNTTDEELLFLKQIGLRWLHADFGEEASYDFVKRRRSFCPVRA